MVKFPLKEHVRVYLCVCVCVCVRARARAHVSVHISNPDICSSLNLHLKHAFSSGFLGLPSGSHDCGRIGFLVFVGLLLFSR